MYTHLFNKLFYFTLQSAEFRSISRNESENVPRFGKCFAKVRPRKELKNVSGKRVPRIQLNVMHEFYSRSVRTAVSPLSDGFPGAGIFRG